mmetsp:Transcript_11297/g.16081  ORF Transcript_11297/g.16081 Transcript_11297/m.16081 type:complete len:245 (+) Transcript_11297:325-1059(+)
MGRASRLHREPPQTTGKKKKKKKNSKKKKKKKKKKNKGQKHDNCMQAYSKENEEEKKEREEEQKEREEEEKKKRKEEGREETKEEKEMNAQKKKEEKKRKETEREKEKEMEKQFGKCEEEVFVVNTKKGRESDQVKNGFGEKDFYFIVKEHYEVGFYTSTITGEDRYYYFYKPSFLDLDVLGQILSDILNFKLSRWSRNSELCTYGTVSDVIVKLTPARYFSMPQCPVVRNTLGSQVSSGTGIP